MIQSFRLPQQPKTIAKNHNYKLVRNWSETDQKLVRNWSVFHQFRHISSEKQPEQNRSIIWICLIWNLKHRLHNNLIHVAELIHMCCVRFTFHGSQRSLSTENRSFPSIWETIHKLTHHCHALTANSDKTKSNIARHELNG